MRGPAAGAPSIARAAPALVRRDLAELLRMAGPVVASRLGMMTMGLTDAVVVGRYSAVQLGYLALGWTLTSVVVVTAIGLLSGVQVMASRALGEERPELAGGALRRGLVYALWIGTAAMAAMIAGGPAFLHVCGIARGLADGATAPLIVLALSMPSFALSVAAGSWMEGLGRPRPVTLFMWGANIINLIVNLALVPGRFGLPPLGASGAAWATFSSRSLLTLALLVYIARMSDARALGVFDKPPRDRPREVEQRRIGYGAGASGFFEVAAFASMTLIAGSISALVVAAYTVVLNVVSFVFMVPLGLSAATGVLVARAYGARRPKELNRVAAIGFCVTAFFGLIAALAVWPTAHAIAASLLSAGLLLGRFWMLARRDAPG